MTRSIRRAWASLIVLVLGASCSDGAARKGGAEPDYREVPEAAAACGLDPHAVISKLHEAPRNNLMVLPFYDNTTATMTEAKACLRAWAAAHGYVFLENESRADD
jgi:hypothetical protein